MNEATLQGFRTLANAMLGKQDWQWIGEHTSQRMFGISEQRAKEWFGGKAEPMTTK